MGGAEFAGQEMTDKSAAGKNVEQVVLTFKNHQTNVHDLGVSGVDNIFL